MPSEETISERELARAAAHAVADPKSRGTALLTPGGSELRPPDASRGSSSSADAAPRSMGHDRTMLPAAGKLASPAAATPDSAASGDPLINATVAGRYRLLERVGEGGMGAVYRGEHITLRKRVAVKFLHAEMSRIPDVVARFEREAVAAANLEHPNVVAAHDFGKTEEGVFFLVMEFVDGGSLRALMETETRLAPLRAAHIARHIASALNRAHSLGIVHRDLKPENVVLVEREADRDFAKVIDFGIAKVAPGKLGEGPALTQAGMVFGTPDYMAPEQALGSKVDHRADLYAFGVMTFEMLVGKRPFEADDVMVLLGKHMTAAPPLASSMVPPGALPPAVDAVLTKILAKAQNDRFQSALEFVQALEGALGIISPAGGTYPPGVLAPIAVGMTPAHGVRAPAPSSITGQVAAIGLHTSPPINSAISPPRPTATEQGLRLAAEVRKDLITGYGGLKQEYAQLKKDPERHKQVLVGVAGIAFVALVAGLIARPSHPRGVAPVSTPTPAVPSSISGLRAPVPTAGTAAPGSPRNTIVAAPTTDTPIVGAEGSPGLPADLAAQLAEYRARPNVRMLLDAARGRQLRAVIAAFEETRTQAPNDPFLAYLLGGLYARARGRQATVIERYADALRVQPDFARDPTLIRDVVRAYAESRPLSVGGEALITGPLAARAAPHLIDGVMNSHSPVARNRLINLLSMPAFAPQFDATMRLLVELSRARSCGEKRPLVEQLGREADGRALTALRAINVGTGCGFFGMSPCNPCLAEAVPAAIRAIEERSR